MQTIEAVQTLDMRGRTISTYVLYQATLRLRKMSQGECLEILVDSFEALQNDIEAWCAMTGNHLVNVNIHGGALSMTVEKGASVSSSRQLAIVISNPGLEELLSPLGFALGAALTNTEVHLIFQGPAVRVLKKGFIEKLSGPNRPFSRFARSGLYQAGHVSPQEKLAQLRELGAHLYVCGPSMAHFGVEKEDLIYEDAIIGEYVTFMKVMRQADIHIFLQ